MTEQMAVPVSWYLLLGAILFAIGAGGVLIRRNAIIILMCIEMMMNAVNLTFIALARYLDSATGQIFVFMIMAVAAVEVAVGLALLVELNRHKRVVNIDEINSLKG
jgi:NADH-quinone oxidoreductase subunit K